MSNDCFPCTMCGECCRHIDAIPELANYHNGDGICYYLKDNKCSIYQTRPDICNVDVMYEKKYKNIFTRTEFYSLNLAGCKAVKSRLEKDILSHTAASYIPLEK